MTRASQSAWSRRRAAVQAETEAEARLVQSRVTAKIQCEQEKKSDADILAELSLQDPDQMKEGDDFSAFLRDEVPARLQRRALRALWRSNPVLACVDELLDYGDDFKTEGIGVEVVKTTYQVGKGMLAHLDEMEQKSTCEPSPEETPPEDVTPDFALTDRTAQAMEPEPALEISEGAQQDEDTATVLTRRRMRFEFQGST